ncbi:MAG: Mur ligase, partial [Fibrobacterales bacterium]|nr:Mur ligase [Fibrobacterales bacterium]
MQGPWFFIGVGGTGMSAIAQLLAFKGEAVSGSDRDFARDADSSVRRGLEKAGV